MGSLIYPSSQFTDHESLPSLQESFSNFTKAFPQYSQTDQADKIREQEYYHLSLSNHVYFDYVGHGLFSYSQQRSHSWKAPVASTSSASPPPRQYSSGLEPQFFDISYKTASLRSQIEYGGQESELEYKTQRRIMALMNLSEDDYSMVFTANQPSAFKLVADSYPFQSNQNLLTVYDYENEAVKVMIQASKNRGARVMTAEFSWPSLRLHSRKLLKKVRRKRKKDKRGLFVFPLQSRMTGARYPYLWMSMAQENGWHVLLDACGLGPKDMETLGLSLFKPDFLLCKAPPRALFSGSRQVRCGSGHSHLEYRGLDHADSLGLILISTRERYLINWLVNALMSLQHPRSENRNPLVRIYGPKVKFDRGPALAFNIFDWKGTRIDPSIVQKLADRNNISLSKGFLFHIWFPDKYEHEKEQIIETRTRKGGKVLNWTREKLPSGISVVTVALGILTNFEDIYRLWAFVSRFLDADFVEKERWRYTALNQMTVEV
ncbi:MOLYBDENUM COFACTOR SULFURASE-LIKE PROTEIN [Salix viminalis]|uniref:MOLYBDENUM COFACTOR SULFURASE-LIKE PROTEIN n=1 Tax=Salix viminalis TaxID=40686 RepID=A0A9Q0T7K5_SALVM|nr:MOLYBDENUM COFACTOR SULFURASE-LIKE PROTEIN [Salix viminalis]